MRVAEGTEVAHIGITLNGKQVDVPAGVTILDAARLHGIEIPTLCHDDQLEPFSSCWLCAVKLEGMRRYVPSCGTKVASGMKIWTDTEDVRAVRTMALELLLSNHRGDCVAPCKATCPAGVDVQGYIALIAQGKYRDATALVKEVNPFPLAIGRVCTRPCEAECRRNAVDGPVAIDYLKRFAADWDAASGEPYSPGVAPATGKKVALVGAGPGSLTAAYYLARRGHRAVVFEALPAAGGMLRYGIPEYRLPKATLDTEIGLITRLGVEIEYGQALGRDFTLRDLFDRGFDAVFLGLGAMGSRTMRVPGEELDGVWAGTEFLKKMGLGDDVRIGKHVAVIGGGNTAVDAARTALRLGADRVTIVYRRSREEMPAWDVEVEAAMHEGVEMHFLAAPTKISGDGRCETMEYIRMELGEPDESGRRRPVPVEGSEEVLAVDNVIAAIGQVPELSCIHDTAETDPESLEAKLGLTRWGTIVADEQTGATTVDRVFAGGDVVRGAATAIEAIADGGRAARAIDRALRAGDADGSVPFFNVAKERWDAFPSDELADIERAPRQEMPELTVEERLETFDEVELGLTEEQALAETKRCLECGCVATFTCKLRQYAAEYGASLERFEGDVVSDPPDDRHPFITLEPEKCILCARCIRICDEVQGASALGLFRRGFSAQMKPSLDRPLAATTCEACGQCVATCPTAALSARAWLPKPGPWVLEETPSVCTFCGTGCSVALRSVADALAEVAPRPGPVSDGNLCVRGRFGLVATASCGAPAPAVRRAGGAAEQVDLDAAVSAAAARLRSVADAHGGAAVAVVGSARLTNEAAFWLQKLGRSVLGTPHVGSLGLERERAVFGALGRAFGLQASTASLADVRRADVILLLESDIAEEQTVAAIAVRKAVRRGARLVVVSPRETRMTRIADTWLRADREDYGRVLSVMLDELDSDAGAGSTEPPRELDGLNELRSRAANRHGKTASSRPEWAESAREAARAFAASGRSVLVANALSFDAPSAALDAALAVAFAAVAGAATRRGSGILFLRAKANGQGVVDAGLTPDLLPGHAAVQAGDARGRPSDGLWDLLRSGRLRALLVVGEDPVGGSADPEAVGSALEKLDLLVVADSMETATTEIADVVLPLATASQSNGTFTNSERRVQRVRAVAPPPTGVSNLELLARLAAALDADLGDPTPEAVRRELAAAARGLSIPDGDLPEHGHIWGGEWLYSDGLATPSGRADLRPSEDRRAEGPFHPRWTDALESRLSERARELDIPPHVVRRRGV